MAGRRAGRILIATWGNPWRIGPQDGPCREYSWERVEYVTEEGHGRYLTPLPLLHSEFGFERIILIVQDTAIYREARDYGSLREAVEADFRKFAEAECPGLAGALEIVVAPGVGTFRNSLGGDRAIRARFGGSIEDFYSYVAMDLAARISDQFDGPGVEVHLDLSHGINYMPALTYRAVRELLSIAAMFEPATLVLWNSEPVMGKAGDAPVKLHRVEEEVRPQPPSPPEAPDGQDCRVLKAAGGAPEERGRAISEDVKGLIGSLGLDMRELKAFASSLANGLPLLAFQTMPNPELLGSYVEGVERIYQEYASVRHGDPMGMEVERLATIQPCAPAISGTLMAARLAARLGGLRRLDRPSLGDLEKAVKGVFGWSQKLVIMMSKDLYKVKNCEVKKAAEGAAPPDGCISLSEVLKECESDRGSSERDAEGAAKDSTLRNFLAHSGLERSITCVQREGEKLRLSYGDKLDKAIDLAIEALKTKGRPGYREVAPTGRGRAPAQNESRNQIYSMR
ncbi:MAG: CRISPR-associated CARF protein Csx1 [Acidianus sp.]|uniref:CRISPR-associated CARF protein Csx1 n=1 Tax=Acidianus sp. TaxID=1872104 RepID=UPI00397CA456